jgi:hypothetical protein
MAEQETKEVEKRKIKVKNASTVGQRFLHDAAGHQHLLGPGQEAEVEVAEPEAKRLEEASKAGSDIRVEGHDPEEPPKNEAAPEVPEEHESRVKLAEKEAELMEAGQEADKDRREKEAKKSGPQRAAETGIHMHARGLEPEGIAAPPDAPPKKKT